MKGSLARQGVLTAQPLQCEDAQNVQADDPGAGDSNGQPHPYAVLPEAVVGQHLLAEGHARIIQVGRIPPVCRELVQLHCILRAQPYM